VPERIDDPLIGKNAVGNRKLVAQCSKRIGHRCSLS
jgi:hypothetical protein